MSSITASRKSSNRSGWMRGCSTTPRLGAEQWRQVVAEYMALIEAETGSAFPQDPRTQLLGAIGAVFASWANPRARTYRRLHEIPDEWCTAVNVQAMVFGNMGEDSGTGVCFTRDPSTGERIPVRRVSGSCAGRGRGGGDCARRSRCGRATGIYAELERIGGALERHFGDMQDVEFTVRAGQAVSAAKRATGSGRRRRHCASRWLWPRKG